MQIAAKNLNRNRSVRLAACAVVALFTVGAACGGEAATTTTQPVTTTTPPTTQATTTQPRPTTTTEPPGRLRAPEELGGFPRIRFAGDDDPFADDPTVRSGATGSYGTSTGPEDSAVILLAIEYESEADAFPETLLTLTEETGSKVYRSTIEILEDQGVEFQCGRMIDERMVPGSFCIWQEGAIVGLVGTRRQAGAGLNAAFAVAKDARTAVLA